MKLLMVLIFAGCFSFVVKAQNAWLFKRNPMKEYKLKQLLNDTLQRINPAPFSSERKYEDEAGVMRFPLKGTFIMENNKGNEMYRMDLDNMICLTPGKTFVDNMAILNMPKTENSEFLLKRNNDNTSLKK